MLYDYSPAEYRAVADDLNDALLQQAESLVNSVSPLALREGRPQHYKNRARLSAAARLAKVNVLFLRAGDEAFSPDIMPEHRCHVHAVIIKLAGIFHAQALDCLSFDGSTIKTGDDQRDHRLEERFARLKIKAAVAEARSQYERRTKGAKWNLPAYRLVDRLLERALSRPICSL